MLLPATGIVRKVHLRNLLAHPGLRSFGRALRRLAAFARPCISADLARHHYYPKAQTALRDAQRTPPTFLLLAENDHVDDVKHSLTHYIALQKAGVARIRSCRPPGVERRAKSIVSRRCHGCPWTPSAPNPQSASASTPLIG